MCKREEILFSERRIVFDNRAEDDEALKRDFDFTQAEEFITQERQDELIKHKEAESDDPAYIIENTRKQLLLPLTQLEATTKGALVEKRVRDKLYAMRKNYPERFKELKKSKDDLNITRDYENIINNIQNSIRQIGAFTLTHGKTAHQIDLKPVDATNSFTTPTGDTVKLKWHTDRLDLIIKKLKRTNLWRTFRVHESAKEFLKLKYRHGLLEGVVVEEVSKVSEEMYNSQIMLDWLKIDGNNLSPTGRPLKALCKKILEPKTLERLSYEDPGNIETRALLKHIITLCNNPDTDQRVRELLEKHAEKNEETKKGKNTEKSEDTKAREGIEEKKDQTLKNLPPRSLLYVIVEDELKQAGVTVKTGLHRQAILRTNLLIAACETSDKAKLANNAVANELKTGLGSSLKKLINRARAIRFFSPLFTLEDALSHTIETIPDLKIFNNINALSTRADLMKNILQYESETQKEVTPAALRKLAGYLEQFIKGTRIEGKVFKVLDREVPKIESIIHMLRLVAEERMARKFINDLKEREINIKELREKDRLKVILGLLKQKNIARNKMDKSIESSIEDRRQNFYKFFLAKNLKKEFNEAIKLTENMGRAIRKGELLSRGLTKKLRKRGAVSIRSPHILRKTAKILSLTATAPLWWPTRGIYRLVGKTKDKWITPILQSKEFQGRAEEQKEMRKGMIVEPLARIIGSVPYFGTWFLTRPKYWLRGLSAKITKKASK